MAHVLNTCFRQEKTSDMLIAIAQLFQCLGGPSSIGWQWKSWVTPESMEWLTHLK